MPARYRQALMETCGGQLVITVDPREFCLLLYPLPAWSELEQEIARMPSFDRSSRMLQRILIGYATETEMDRQGRMLLPQELRTRAKLDKQAMLVGQGRRFELWDEATWLADEAAWIEDMKSGDDEAEFVLPAGFENFNL